MVREWFIVAMVDSAGLQFIVMCNGGFLCTKEVDNDLRCSLGEFCEEGASSQLILALSPRRAMACTMHYMCVGGAAAVSYEYGIKVMCCYVCKASFSMWQPEEGIYVPLEMKSAGRKSEIRVILRIKYKRKPSKKSPSNIFTWEQN